MGFFERSASASAQLASFEIFEPGGQPRTTLTGASPFFITPHEFSRGQLRPALHNRMEFPQRFPVTRFQNVRGELIQHRRYRG